MKLKPLPSVPAGWSFVTAGALSFALVLAACAGDEAAPTGDLAIPPDFRPTQPELFSASGAQPNTWVDYDLESHPLTRVERQILARLVQGTDEGIQARPDARVSNEEMQAAGQLSPSDAFIPDYLRQKLGE